MTEPNADIQKIEENIRQLEDLKSKGLMPAELADVSIAALRSQLTTFSAKLEGDGAIAQGNGAIALGQGAVMADGDISGVVNTGYVSEINIDSQPRAKKESLREAYLNYMLGLTSPLAISGVVRQSAGEAETRMNLSAVYTALLTQAGTEEADQQKESQHKIQPLFQVFGFPQRRLSVVERLNNHSRLVLLGDPGSGKSTFVNYLALCMLGEALGRADANLKELTRPLPLDEEYKRRLRTENKEPKPQPWEHGALLPVRIILRDFAVRNLPEGNQPATAEHIWNFIETELAGAALSEYVPLLKKELREQGGLLLLDGLDEVPEAERRRQQIKQAIESFASSFPRCRFLVTSRTYAYQNQDWKLKGFSESTLAPFTKGQVTQFVDHWYAHIAQLRKQNAADAQAKAEVLKNAILSNERLMGLAERPLLLTLMASLHAWRGGTLPDKREELYADAVDLLLERWESQRTVRDPKSNAQILQPSLAEWLKVDRDKVRGLLNQIAFEAHNGQSEMVGTADVPESALIAGLMQLSQNPDVKPGRLIEYLRDRAGLLIPRGVGVYTFPHRTFQEYLAACYLTDHDYPDEVARLVRSDPTRWRETTLLAGAKAARGANFALWSLVDALSPEADTGSGDTRYWGAQIAGQAVVEIADLKKTSASNTAKITRLRNRLLDIMEGDRLPAIERAQAGSNLALLDDPRFTAESWYLPADETLGFHRIPAGKFLMGSDPKQDEQADEVEQPQHELDISYDYYVARYPVTVAQYKLFVELTGYKTSNENSLNGIPNHPVVSVSWYDSLKYCRWLDQNLKALSSLKVKDVQDKDQLAFWQGLTENRLWVSLPSEAECEKAARGSDGRIYPWGDEFDPNKANMSDTGIDTTSAVGCFPTGASPYGLLDMSGNVYEWTRSIYGEWDNKKLEHKNENRYPYQLNDGREDLSKGDDFTRVLRGGAFNRTSGDVRCALRYGDFPDYWYIYFGFRVVVSPLLLS